MMTEKEELGNFKVFENRSAKDPNKDLQTCEGIDGSGPYTETLVDGSPEHFSRSV